MVKIKITNGSDTKIWCKGTGLERVKECALAASAAIEQIIAVSGKEAAKEIVRQIFSEDAKNPVTVGADNGETTERFD